VRVIDRQWLLSADIVEKVGGSVDFD